MKNTTWVEINQSYLQHNINQYKKWLHPSTLIAPVIKGNAYGHGIGTISTLLENNSTISILCVVTTQEAIVVRKNGYTKRIFVIGYINTSLQSIIDYNIEVTVFDIVTLQQLDQLSIDQNKQINIHLKIDTGLSRLGFLPQEYSKIYKKIIASKHLQLLSVFSHCAEGGNKNSVSAQEHTLQSIIKENIPLHLQTSLSVFHTSHNYAVARIGIGTYGYLPGMSNEKQRLLHPILSLKSTIINIKTVNAHCSIGYDKTFTTKRKSVIATISAGYYDGINTDLSNNGWVLIKGKRAPIVGKVNMNYTLVDITNIPESSLYDTVTIIGKEKDQSITMYDWSSITHQKNVRCLLTYINPLLPRIIV